MFDSVKKLPADVVRQYITNAGGPEASRYPLDLCAPLSSWAGPVKNKTNTTREKPSNITYFRPVSSAGWCATSTALQLTVSSSAVRTRATIVYYISNAFLECATIS